MTELQNDSMFHLKRCTVLFDNIYFILITYDYVSLHLRDSLALDTLTCPAKIFSPSSIFIFFARS